MIVDILYILLAIALLGVLVMVHEFGHYIVGRLTGMTVLEFSIGFGPKLLGWKRKASTTPCAPCRWAAIAASWARTRTWTTPAP